MNHCKKDSCLGVSLSFIIVFLMIMSYSQVNAQSIQRQSIGMMGVNMAVDGFLVKLTIGQPYATTTSYANGVGYRPGFQQPYASSHLSVVEQELLPQNLSFQVFPNPATSSVSIEATGVIANGLLRVMDSKGRIVINQQLSEFRNQSIDCQKWPNGLYYISIGAEGNVSYSSKLIISK